MVNQILLVSLGEVERPSGEQWDGELKGMEGLEILGGLAHADVAHGELEGLGDVCSGCAALPVVFPPDGALCRIRAGLTPTGSRITFWVRS